MAKIINFPKKHNANLNASSLPFVGPQVAEPALAFFPNVFKKLIEFQQKRKNEIRQKKINFLYNEAFQYFYDLQEAKEIINPGEIGFLPFVWEKQKRKQAEWEATHAILRLIAKDLIDISYSIRIKDIKNKKKAAR